MAPDTLPKAVFALALGGLALATVTAAPLQLQVAPAGSGALSVSSGNGWLDISDNRLRSLNLAGCPGLVAVFAGNNELQPAAVDEVLQTLDVLGRFRGYLDLQGNYPATSTGLQYAANLRKKHWTVNLAADAPVQPPAGSIAFSTEKDTVAMEVQVSGGAQVTWYWSDGSSETGLTPVHRFAAAGYRKHFLTVDPPAALTYFGAPFGVERQGIVALSGACRYPRLSFVYLSGESLTELDIAGCDALRDLHLAANAALAPAALDKVFADLDLSGGYGGTVSYPAALVTAGSAESRARLMQKGWKLLSQ
jgi:hypothetical protein